MEEEQKKITLTRRGWALALAIKAGLIQRDTDGSADISAFDRFWDGVEGEIFPQVCREMENYLREKPGKKLKHLFRRP